MFDSLNYLDNLLFGLDTVHAAGGIAEGARALPAQQGCTLQQVAAADCLRLVAASQLHL